MANVADRQYKLQYFPITALGEPIRMTFALVGTPLEDERVPGSEWADKKAAMPYGQMPVLTVTESDGSSTKMSQAKSILRYLGKIFMYEGRPLYPADPVLAYKCDEVMDLIEDIRGPFVKTFAIKDEGEKKAARLALVSEGGAMLEKISMLEARLGGTWVNGDSLSIADIYVTCTLADFEQPTFLDGFPEGTYAKFPNILKLRSMVVSLPPVVEHYKSEAPDSIRSTLKM